MRAGARELEIISLAGLVFLLSCPFLAVALRQDFQAVCECPWLVAWMRLFSPICAMERTIRVAVFPLRALVPVVSMCVRAIGTVLRVADRLRLAVAKLTPRRRRCVRFRWLLPSRFSRVCRSAIFRRMLFYYFLFRGIRYLGSSPPPPPTTVHHTVIRTTCCSQHQNSFAIRSCPAGSLASNCVLRVLYRSAFPYLL